MAGDITQTQGEMESEFGMEGNVPADGETGYKTEDGSDAGETEPGQGELPDAIAIAKETDRIEEIEGLDNLKSLSVAELMGEAIHRIHNDQSVSSLFR